MAEKQKIQRPEGVGERHIHFTVEEDGNVIVEPVGFVGGACKVATEQYEQVLGTVQSRKLTGPGCAGQGVRIQGS